uniref:Uncharacterized protein n=1 Tax=Oryzias latipes TaxID=8090 RepID=A0A3P9JRT1_ORYLA
MSIKREYCREPWVVFHLYLMDSPKIFSQLFSINHLKENPAQITTCRAKEDSEGWGSLEFQGPPSPFPSRSRRTK